MASSADIHENEMAVSSILSYLRGLDDSNNSVIAKPEAIMNSVLSDKGILTNTSNLNSLNRSGFYFLIPEVSLPTNAPYSGCRGILLNMESTGHGLGAQIFINTSGGVYVRGSANIWDQVWGDWKTL